MRPTATTEITLAHADAQLDEARERLFDLLRIPKSIRGGVNQTVRNRLIYGFVAFAFFAIISIYVWFISAGTWTTWDTR